jgi:ribulose 1,5-bisphosphate synthetase/thiazole synthase
MSTSIVFSRTVPVRHEVDVFVAGGGPAGISAALVAARQGKSVFLAEGHSCFGGMGTAGMIPVFMMFGDGVNFLAEGIGREVLDALTAEKGPDSPLSTNSIPAELMKRVYDRLLVEAGIELSLMTQVVDVVAKDGRVEQAICHAKSGFFAVSAKMFVDGTGDGDLAAWAGAPFEKGDVDGSMMPGTLTSLWADVDYERFRASGVKVQEQLFKAFEDGIFTVNDPHHPGMWQVGNHMTGGNIGHAFGLDSTDERSLTEHFINARKHIPEFESFYRTYIPGYENLELAATGSLFGVRESRRIMGDYVLDVDDFLARAVFEDEIGRYCYPVDIHPSKPDAKEYEKFEAEFRKNLRYDRGESYGIPYRILTPKTLENVLVTGRCVSSDRKIQGSIRVMPGCYITGQAAGMAAAIAIEKKTDTRGFAVTELLSRLQGMGAYLPNFAG